MGRNTTGCGKGRWKLTATPQVRRSLTDVKAYEESLGMVAEETDGVP